MLPNYRSPSIRKYGVEMLTLQSSGVCARMSLPNKQWQ